MRFRKARSSGAGRTRGTSSRTDTLPGGPRWLALVFLLPALLLLAIYVVYPIIFVIGRSLYDSSGTEFVGLRNYGEVFTESRTLTAIKNNAIWVIVAPTVVTALGLVFAVLAERIRWAAAFRLVLFMPMAISLFASGIIFRLVYEEDPELGVVNAVAVSIHDVFASSSEYPGARPRDPLSLVAEDGGYVTTTAQRKGDVTLLPLVGLQQQRIPEQARQASVPSPAAGELRGVVWLDVSTSGGQPGQVGPGKRGLPRISVEAVRDGQVVARTTTGDDGRFTLPDLLDGSYTLRLPESNFAKPFRGLTWLGPTLITPVIISAWIWIMAGFAMTFIATGLAAIPREALEAARVDGATEWQVFRRVTIPLLSPVLLVVFVTLVITVLKVFELVFVIAPGSVQDEANVLALEMWQVAFGTGGEYGIGSALGVILFLLVVPAMVFNIRRFRRER